MSDLAVLLATDELVDAGTLEGLIEIDARELASARLPNSIETAARPQPAFEMPAFEAPAADADTNQVPAEEVPAELAEVFAQEAAEHLQTIARLTAQMSAGTNDREGLQELRRAVHTLKGAAGVVGYMVASKLAHRMEDLLDRLYEGTAELTPPAVRALASSSDALDEAINGSGDPAALRGKIGRLFGEFDGLVGAMSMGVTVPDFHLLTRELAETANEVSAISARGTDRIGDFDSDLTRLGRVTREIQDKTLEFRMVPLGTLTTRLERVVRVTAESCGKLVDLAIEGEHVALDKSLLEHMSDPLLHLLRNAVDHGIEAPEARGAKAARGRIVVRAYDDGTDVVIEVEDDGRGLDVERIRRTAVDRGLVGGAEAATLAPEALFAFVFEPGFSTAKTISEISGRGVGMDVVKSKVSRVGGRTRIDSRPGEGTRMSVRVPTTW